MSLELAYCTFYNIPVGLVDDIIHTIALVSDEEPTIKYCESINDVNKYSLASSNIKDDWEAVDMYISYYIDYSMIYSFQLFLAKYVQDKCKAYNLLEDCWSLTND